MRGLISSFTSARMMREGSVGLLLLVGLGAFGTILLWLNRITPGETSYRAIIEFANAGGMQKGSVVRFRGVKVGTITKLLLLPPRISGNVSHMAHLLLL